MSMVTEIEGHEFECEACGELYPSMRYIVEVEFEGEILFACNERPTCRDVVVEKAEEDRVARAERGKRLKDRADREARETATPIVVVAPPDLESHLAKIEALLREVEALRGEIETLKES